MNKKLLIVLVLMLFLPINVNAAYLLNPLFDSSDECLASGCKHCDFVEADYDGTRKECKKDSDCQKNGGYGLANDSDSDKNTCYQGYCTINSNIGRYKCMDKEVDEGKVNPDELSITEKEVKVPTFDIPGPNLGSGNETCAEILGESLTKVVKLVVDVVKIAGVIICIVNGMLTFIPAVIGKDEGALKKATSKFVKMLIICAVILLLPTLINLIGNIAEFDLSCIF